MEILLRRDFDLKRLDPRDRCLKPASHMLAVRKANVHVIVSDGIGSPPIRRQIKQQPASEFSLQVKPDTIAIELFVTFYSADLILDDTEDSVFAAL